MKSHPTPPSMPIHDYSSAVQGAVSWLGERYLLATPINPRRPRPAGAAWYVAPGRWLDARKQLRG